MKSIMRFLRDDSGADLVEYALLVGIVALGAITSLTGVRNEILKLFQSIITGLSAPIPAPPAPAAPGG
jgi:Flp pilus assembly pilin Flp